MTLHTCGNFANVSRLFWWSGTRFAATKTESHQYGQGEACSSSGRLSNTTSRNQPIDSNLLIGIAESDPFPTHTLHLLILHHRHPLYLMRLMLYNLIPKPEHLFACLHDKRYRPPVYCVLQAYVVVFICGLLGIPYPSDLPPKSKDTLSKIRGYRFLETTCSVSEEERNSDAALRNVDVLQVRGVLG